MPVSIVTCAGSVCGTAVYACMKNIPRALSCTRFGAISGVIASARVVSSVMKRTESFCGAGGGAGLHAKRRRRTGRSRRTAQFNVTALRYLSCCFSLRCLHFSSSRTVRERGFFDLCCDLRPEPYTLPIRKAGYEPLEEGGTTESAGSIVYTLHCAERAR